MDLVLTPREQSAFRRVLLAEPDPRTVLGERTLDDLTTLLPCDRIGVAEDHHGTSLRGLRRGGGAVPDRDDCCGPELETGVHQVAALGDGDEDVAFLRRLGLRDTLRVGFSCASGSVAQLHLSRTERFFTTRDVTLLGFLEPVLGRLLRAPAGVTPPAVLTAREQQVLGLVARGVTDREVAEELYISLPTVRKHLEHTYRKLGVTSRTGAVAALRPVAFVP